MAKLIKKAQKSSSLLPGLDKVKATLNPKNWGVPDYSDKGSRDAAYAAARKAGEKEFMWNNQRYSTLNSGTSNQQYRMYGNTNKQIFGGHDKSMVELSNNMLNGEGVDRLLTLDSISGYNKYVPHVPKNLYERSHYQKGFFYPISNKGLGIHLTEAYHAVPELSHSWQFTKDPYFNFLIPHKKENKYYIEGTKNENDDRYRTPHALEYEAHSTIEPVFDLYLRGGIDKEDIPYFIKALRTNTFDRYYTKEERDKYAKELLEKDGGIEHKIDETIKTYEPEVDINDSETRERWRKTIMENNQFNANVLRPVDGEDGKLKPYPGGIPSDKFVYKLQKSLHDKGYKLSESTKENGDFDGIMGKETRKAMIDYFSKINDDSYNPYKEAKEYAAGGHMKNNFPTKLDGTLGNETKKVLTYYKPKTK